jgi:hypothetical protein
MSRRSTCALRLYVSHAISKARLTRECLLGAIQHLSRSHVQTQKKTVRAGARLWFLAKSALFKPPLTACETSSYYIRLLPRLQESEPTILPPSKTVNSAQNHHPAPCPNLNPHLISPQPTSVPGPLTSNLWSHGASLCSCQP